VLREGEQVAPAGLVAALHRANRLQELLLEEMEPGRTGNDVLERTLARMREEGIDGSVYTHPIGDHGHGAGPTIGLWDRQDGVPGRGDVALRPNTWFSIELQATTPVPEWDHQPVRMAQEEEALIAGDGARHWVLRRQSEFHIVR
jgi:Xaa-Pro aminopeptidase